MIDHLSMMSQFFETVNRYSHCVNCLILGNDKHSGHENTANGRASDRVRKKFGNNAALLSLIMQQERSIMRQIM